MSQSENRITDDVEVVDLHEIDDATRRRLLQLLDPSGWELLAECFDGTTIRTGAARIAVKVEDFLKGLMHHEDFEEALAREQTSARQRPRRFAGRKPGRPRNGKKG